MIEKALSLAMRGRWIDNKWCQQLEINNEKYSNTITTVQKDTLILVNEWNNRMAEIKQIGGFAENKRKDGTYQTGYTVYDKEGICPTLLADGGGYGIMIIEEEKK